MANVEETLAGLSLEDAEKEEVVRIALSRSSTEDSLENCFASSFFTTSIVNFQAMKATLANVWHPIREISISDLAGGALSISVVFQGLC